jgi:hypothetical protein
MKSQAIEIYAISKENASIPLDLQNWLIKAEVLPPTTQVTKSSLLCKLIAPKQYI